MRLFVIFALVAMAALTQLVCCLFFRDGTTPQAGICGVIALASAGAAGSAIERWVRE